MKKTILLAMAILMTAISLADARPRPNRPPWQDVCCGGPCCVKPQRPGR
jgi:hypothetical protein